MLVNTYVPQPPPQQMKGVFGVAIIVLLQQISMYLAILQDSISMLVSALQIKPATTIQQTMLASKSHQQIRIN